MKHPSLVSLLACALALPCSAETVKDREGSVRNDKAAMEKNTRWIYNDWAVGLAEGKKTGKPVMMVLRCVPCVACTGIDAQVLLEDSELKPLMDQFICVRIINANALDLSLFQFDYDLSFSTLFCNGDGTLYARYGSWTHQKNAQDKTTSGYRKAMEGALALHRGYPANRASLAGKQGPRSEYKTPVDIPTLSGKFKLDLDWSGKVVPSCVHCHQISDAQRLNLRKAGQPIPDDLIYSWPGSDTIGLTLAVDHPARVEALAPGSIAARAGLRAGDDILSIEGQPLLSTADFSWVLHRAPAQGALAATVQRDGREVPLRIELPQDWRRKTDIARRVGTWGFRGMATGGLQLEDLSDEERAKRALTTAQLGLSVKHVGEYGKHAAAKKAGFQKGDIIVEMESISGRRSEGELIGHLIQQRKAGDKVKTTVLRNGQRVDLLLPVQ